MVIAVESARNFFPPFPLPLVFPLLGVGGTRSYGRQLIELRRASVALSGFRSFQADGRK